ncbi:MAG: S-layer protein, partial [Candidatus Aenigmarchaeota archaeon]|nr:S-layer protein [Candidatus Aenigmarchaeota archaeon]
MQLRNVVKTIAAGTLAAVMAGATLGFAATLADYPAPFVTDGSADTLIVVGANAAPVDVVGAIDIAARLGAEPSEEKTITVPGSAATTTVSGGVALETENTKLYLGSNITEAKQALTSEDLPMLLSSGKFTDDSGEEYEYDQYIYPGTVSLVFDKPGDLDDPVVYVNTGSDTIYTATVVFNDEVNFSSSDVQGNEIT